MNTATILTPLASRDDIIARVRDEQCVYSNVMTSEALNVMALCLLYRMLYETHPNKNDVTADALGDWAEEHTLLNNICDKAEALLDIDTSGMEGEPDDIARFTHATDIERVEIILSMLATPLYALLPELNTMPVYLILDNGGSLDAWGNALAQGESEDSPILVFGDSLSAASLHDELL
ncbi:MAG: hypothetical protein VYD08_04015, partial [Pseudomonadota bacterium]|nr:hypothetical protein [Pseudomonadota bacterium]